MSMTTTASGLSYQDTRAGTGAFPVPTIVEEEFTADGSLTVIDGKEKAAP